MISNLVNGNSVTTSICLNNDIIYLTSIYCPPSGNLAQDLEDVANHFSTFDKMIIGGDLNVPLIRLGYARESSRTDELLEFLTENDLHIVNDARSPYTFIQGSLSGRPDLTIVGLDVLNKIFNWSVDDQNFSFSDHRYIRFELDYDLTTNFEKRLKTKNKNFFRFNQKVGNYAKTWSRNLENVITATDLDSHTEHVMHDIIKISESCFRYGDLSYTPTHHWFSNKLKILRNQVSAAYKRTCRNPDSEWARDTYRKLRRTYKKTIRRAKLDSWLGFCEQTSESFGTLYKHISGKALSNTDLIFTRLESNTVFDSYNEVARNLLRVHFNINNIPDDISSFTSCNDYTNYVDYQRVTTKEIYYAMQLQNNNKAPGPDLLDALIVKNSCKTNIEYFKNLFSRCLSLGHFPRVWKKGKVIFFRKKNKDGKNEKGYRPITLLPIFAKILERIIKSRIMIQLENRKFFNDEQYGFREGRSTTEALRKLKFQVDNMLKVYKYVAATSLDIQAAFDNISWAKIYSLIDKLPIPEYLRAILKNYISDRQIGYKFTNIFAWFKLFRGCPQGSCLGPLLWLIVADFILKEFYKIFTDLISYADDFLVLAGADTRRALENEMNKKIQKFVDICNELDLEISKGKCVSILFGRFDLERRPPIFKVENTSISVKGSLDYLGFRVDGKFNWFEHLDFIKEKIDQFSSSVRKSSNRNKGLSAVYRKIWYKAIIEKQIVYGAEIWYPDLNSHGLRRLNSCQRLGLRTIIKTYRNVSTEALCVLTGVVPIQIYLNNHIKVDKVLHASGSIEIDGTIVTRDNIMTILPKSSFPHYNMLNNLYVKPETDRARSTLIIYTDGSKMELGVGAAFAVYLHNEIIFEKKIRLHSLNSVYQAELIAILHAIKWVMDSCYNSAHIFTDSMSSTYALQFIFPRNDIIKDIFTVLLQNPNKKVYISWVKAHVGLEGNERADLLAKEAITGDTDVHHESVGFPKSCLKNWMRHKVITDWQSDWQVSDKGRDTYSVINKVDTEYICTDQVIQYFISGHGSFPEFLYDIKKKSSPNCECGNLGSVSHYLFARCPLMPHYFHFDRNRTLRQNLRAVLLDRNNYGKLYDIYNELNSRYSFIKYKF